MSNSGFGPYSATRLSAAGIGPGFGPGFGIEAFTPSYPRLNPPIGTLDAVLQTQSHGLNLPALAAFAQQYAAAHNKHNTSNLKPITPRKGAEVGAVALAAMGYMLHGLNGLFTGILVGAGAGASIVALLRDKHPKAVPNAPTHPRRPGVR